MATLHNMCKAVRTQQLCATSLQIQQLAPLSKHDTVNSSGCSSEEARLAYCRSQRAIMCGQQYASDATSLNRRLLQGKPYGTCCASKLRTATLHTNAIV